MTTDDELMSGDEVGWGGGSWDENVMARLTEGLLAPRRLSGCPSGHLSVCPSLFVWLSDGQFSCLFVYPHKYQSIFGATYRWIIR